MPIESALTNKSEPSVKSVDPVPVPSPLDPQKTLFRANPNRGPALPFEQLCKLGQRP